MFKKRFSMAAVLCLALAALLPSSSSALTLSELLGSSAQSSYTPVTITSATNKTITITATPLSYSSNQWLYQVSWNRAKNAKGSLYVSLKSNNGTKVATVATADQAGSTTFTALPSTAYRVEFYSQPNGKGSLLVRKYFTALAAEKAVATTSGSTYNSFYTNSTASTSSGNGNLSSAGGTVGLGSSVSSVSAVERLGTRVSGGKPIPLPTPTDCSAASGPYAINNGGYAGSTDMPPINSYCYTDAGSLTIGLGYRSSATGQCYWQDWKGLWQIPCSNNMQTMTTDSVGNLLSPVTPGDKSVNWNSVGGVCVAMYHDGSYFQTVCAAGDSHGKDWGLSQQQFCAQNPGDTSCTNAYANSSYSAGSGNSTTSTMSWSAVNSSTAQYVAPGFGTSMQPQNAEKLGTRVAGGKPIPLPTPTDCSAASGPYAVNNGGYAGSTDMPPINSYCYTDAGSLTVGAAYRSSATGQCYWQDWKGLWQVPCNNYVQTLPTDNVGNLLAPITPGDKSINWNANGGYCVAMYHDGSYFQTICAAGDTHGHDFGLSQDQFCAKNPTDTSCTNSYATQVYSPNAGSGSATTTIMSWTAASGTAGQATSLGYGYSVTPSQGERIGTKVAGGKSIPLPTPTDCSAASGPYAIANGAYAGSTDMPPIGSYCYTDAGNLTLGMAYKSGTTGQCYWQDWKGLWQVPCNANLQTMTTDSTGNLLSPITPGDKSVNWNVNGGYCAAMYHDGSYFQTICAAGDSHGHDFGLTQDQFCAQHPSDTSCAKPTITNPAATTSTAQTTSSSPVLTQKYSVNPTTGFCDWGSAPRLNCPAGQRAFEDPNKCTQTCTDLGF